MAEGVLVGRVAAVLRYPVKSMAAEPVEDVDVSWHGLSGDRRWAFVRPGLAGNGFPWLTLRQRNDLNDYHPCWTEREHPETSAVIVRTPAGARFDVTAPALAAELGEGVRVMKLNRGTFDTMPLSLITTRTVESLGALLGTELNVLRFRPNLVIEAFGVAAFPEDEWVGKALTVGTMWMRLDRRDKRCVVVNVDPVTGRRDPEVLRTDEARALGIDVDDPRALAWMEEHLPKFRRVASGQRPLYWILGIGFVVGLAAHVAGYLLLSSVTTEPFLVLADLLYALGWALWTSVIVVVFVQIWPEAKRRQLRRWLDAYEAALREKARAGGDQASGDDEAPTAR